jgi:hypothetical protein
MSATRPQPPQRSRRRGLLSLGLLWVLSSQPAQARHRDEALTQVQRLLSEDRISEAATALAPLLGNNTKDPELELLRGELQFLQGEYAAGAERMRGALAVLKLPSPRSPRSTHSGRPRSGHSGSYSGVCRAKIRGWTLPDSLSPRSR